MQPILGSIQGVSHAEVSGFDPGADCNLLTRRVLANPRVTYSADAKAQALVIALHDELLVHPQHADFKKLSKFAVHVGPHARLNGDLSDTSVPPGCDIQVWKLKDPKPAKHEIFDVARHTRELWKGKGPDGHDLVTVTPHHIAVVSAGGVDHYNTCPYGPPSRHNPAAAGWIPAFAPAPGHAPVTVAVLDTGFIPGNGQLHQRQHITAVKGRWLDATGQWQPSDNDGADLDGNHVLDLVAGHGTFSTGLIAHRSPEAEITVVSHRHEVFDLNGADAYRLFTTEISVAASLVRHRHKQVVLCQFAFPTLDGYPSLPLSCALRSLDANGPVIVAPAGNEDTSAPYWPAAHSRVKGVGSTEHDGPQAPKADFSNKGAWVDVYAKGAHVLSTFIKWHGKTEPTPMKFDNWATWNGTCFAAAKVTGAIAHRIATSGLPPTDAYNDLLSPSAIGGVPDPNQSVTIQGFDPVPRLDLG